VQPSAYANGDPTAGKAVFNQMECAACHTLSAAGATGTVGPNLDLLHREAARAGQPLGAYTASAIVDPDAHPVPGYPSGVMPSYRRLSSSQIADLVAYLTATR
jgi:cytochrome c2